MLGRAGWISPRCGERCSRVRSDGRRGHRKAHGRRQGGVHGVNRDWSASESDGCRDQLEENNNGARWKESKRRTCRL